MNMESEEENPIPKGKIYTEKEIKVGTFIGGPFVAGYLMAANFKVFGNEDHAKKAMFYGIIVTIALCIGVSFIPENVNIPAPVIPITYFLVASALAKHYQAKAIETHISAGGQISTWGRTIAVSLIGLAIMIGLITIIYFGIGQFIKT
jgi:hypothetical protein